MLAMHIRGRYHERSICSWPGSYAYRSDSRRMVCVAPDAMSQTMGAISTHTGLLRLPVLAPLVSRI